MKLIMPITSLSGFASSSRVLAISMWPLGSVLGYMPASHSTNNSYHLMFCCPEILQGNIGISTPPFTSPFYVFKVKLNN